jgi:hypothetical protein
MRVAMKGMPLDWGGLLRAWPGGQLGADGMHHGARQGRSDGQAQPVDQGGVGLSADAAVVLQELIRQAAQGEVVHNDDTGMRVLTLERDAEISAKRTGVFTSGIVSIAEGHRMALFFTGCKRAGENLADVLKKRAAELPPPIQMCDALSRNVPKLPASPQTLLANCNAHGRRNFVKVIANFPEECRFVLESLGKVYHHGDEARVQKLSAEERLRFHQEHSGPVMKELHDWLDAQFQEKQVEPNSGLGKAIAYLLRHWEKLTLFLKEPGAPLDNSSVTPKRSSDIRRSGCPGTTGET